MSHVVLQNNEHDGTQGNHPQQGIAEPRTCGNIGSPIARINKTNRNQQPGTNVFQYFQSAKSRTVILTVNIFDKLYHQSKVRKNI